ncbi:MAG: hypothetical protein ACYDAL_09220 [Candidatus Dormibacteraceae bacterium]
MAHLSDGTLRRMVDEPDAHGGADARHLETCAGCQARYSTVSRDARAISSLLGAPELNVDIASAFNRVQAAPAARPRFGLRLPMMRPGSRPLVLAFATAVAAVALLVTAIAQDSNTFTPQTLAPVPVTMADMQALSQLSAYGTISWTKQPQPQIVTSADEAKTISGLPVPKVATLPAGVSSTVTYAAMGQATAIFTFSKDKAAAAAAQAGKTLPALPSGMDGARLTVTVGPAVAEIYGNITKPGASDITQASLPQLIVGETTAPVATSSQVTVVQFENYLLSQPGISAELKAAIRAIGDPSTTLPIPIPVQFATSSTVTIQGVQGLALGDNTGVGAGAIWIKHGVVYGVVGTIKRDDAVNVANQLT